MNTIRAINERREIIMELHIEKSQLKGLFGGVQLVITTWVDLTDEEQNLIKKYKANRDTIHEGYVRSDTKALHFTVDSMIKKSTFKYKKIEDLLRNESITKEAYDALMNRIEELKQFEANTSKK